jgi:hypothetical protein
MFNCCLCIDERTLITLFGVFILKNMLFHGVGVLDGLSACTPFTEFIGVCLEDDFWKISILFRCAMHIR